MTGNHGLQLSVGMRKPILRHHLSKRFCISLKNKADSDTSNFLADLSSIFCARQTFIQVKSICNHFWRHSLWHLQLNFCAHHLIHAMPVVISTNRNYALFITEHCHLSNVTCTAPLFKQGVGLACITLCTHCSTACQFDWLCAETYALLLLGNTVS